MTTSADEKKTVGEFLQITATVIVLYLVVRYGVTWAMKKDALANKNVVNKVKDEA